MCSLKHPYRHTVAEGHHRLGFFSHFQMPQIGWAPPSIWMWVKNPCAMCQWCVNDEDGDVEIFSNTPKNLCSKTHEFYRSNDKRSSRRFEGFSWPLPPWGSVDEGEWVLGSLKKLTVGELRYITASHPDLRLLNQVDDDLRREVGGHTVHVSCPAR